VPSWLGCGRLALAVWPPNLKLRSWWLSRQPLIISEPRGRFEFQHHAPGGPLYATSGEECGPGIPESVVRRSWSPWTFMSGRTRSCVPAVVTKTTPRTAHPPPLHWVSGARAWGVQGAINHRTLRPASVDESCVSTKVPLKYKRCQRIGHTQRNCGYAPRCVACGWFHLSGGCPTPREQTQCCGCRCKQTANYRVCVKWKEARAVFAKQATDRVRKNAATGHPAPPKNQQAGPSAEQTNLGEGLNHIVHGGACCQGHYSTPSSNPKPTRQTVTEVPKQPKGTATRKTAGPKKPESKSTAATKPVAGKSKTKAAASVKKVAAKPTTPDLVVPTQSPTSPIEDISDLLERLPYKHIWSWLVGSSRPSPPSPLGQFARGLFWRPLLSSWQNMAARSRRKVRSKALRLAC